MIIGHIPPRSLLDALDEALGHAAPELPYICRTPAERDRDDWLEDVAEERAFWRRHGDWLEDEADLAADRAELAGDRMWE